MDIKTIVNSRIFKIIFYTIGTCLIALFLFEAGVFVGFKRAEFSNKIGENYFREMSGRNSDAMLGMGIGDDDFIDAHGAVGQIVELKPPLFVVEDRGNNNLEKVIRIASSTVIKDASGTGNISDIELGDFVTVFGSSPDQSSVITAELVRILPAPTATASSSTINK